MMKRVLVVITTGFMSNGGLTSVMMNYYKQLNKSLFKVDFASTNIPPYNDAAYEYLCKNYSNYYCLGNRKKNLFKYLAGLYLIIKKENYDIVHVNGNSATIIFELIICKMLGVRKIIAHGHTTRGDHPYVHRFFKCFLKWFYTQSIAVSDEAGKWLFGKGYIVLNNAINTDDYIFNAEVRKNVRNQLGINDKQVIGHVGKLYYPKNHFFIIDVFNEYLKINKDSVLLLVGGGELEQKLQDKAHYLGIKDKIIFLGMRNDIPRIIQAFDYFIFPSIYEGLGLAVIEAQASGLYCLASTNVPIETKITENIEYLDLNEGATKWAQKIYATIGGDRASMSQDSKMSMINYGYDVKYEVKKLEQLYLC